jgi:hypothetical protein
MHTVIRCKTGHVPGNKYKPMNERVKSMFADKTESRDADDLTGTDHAAWRLHGRLISLTECDSGISKKKVCFRNEQKKMYLQLCLHLVFWNSLENTDFNFISLLVVFIVLSLIVVLTRNGENFELWYYRIQ